MSNFKKMVEENSDKYPARMGQPWRDDEVLKLLTSIQKQKSVKEIATEHQRTITGITSELRKLATEYHFNDNRPIEEIQKYTGLSKEAIADAIRRRKWKEENKEDKKTVKKEEKVAEVSVVAHMSQTTEMQEMIFLLKDIQSKLSSLLDKVA